ncbi:unnamed protein product [Paramecium pentaurelia]|uniref:Palmitoyl-protein thioesterase 1 n=1 Tax=Paramecium pentaurelia TaxID=43138 RepID=A0A8S1SEU5_9CILI|nr:unnamed protein product [Paramecium pentaurelia]
MFLLIPLYFFLGQTLPTVLFHGLGDSCSWSLLKSFFSEINAECIEIGSGPSSSILLGFLDQAKDACIKVQEKYAGQTINVVGLSQGALIGRYIITDCDLKGGRVSKYLSIGGPQMGVSVIPHCNSYLCWPLNKVVDSLVYTDYVQQHIGPAGYFRNHEDLDSYLKYNHFLPDLNNERNPECSRRQKFSSLDQVMLVKFLQDEMVLPKESAFFESVDPETGLVIPLIQSEFYIQDYIGLKQLDQQRKIKFIEIDDSHLKWTDEITKNVFIPFLI